MCVSIPNVADVFCEADHVERTVSRAGWQYVRPYPRVSSFFRVTAAILSFVIDEVSTKYATVDFSIELFKS